MCPLMSLRGVFCQPEKLFKITCASYQCPQTLPVQHYLATDLEVNQSDTVFSSSIRVSSVFSFSTKLSGVPLSL